jgi:ABC-type branched-subunit amino acid transport system ATPase component/branched-subunit amino acid ABC-type transport system permease component
MSEVIQFGIFGLGIGAVYALAAQGLLLIYRGSGVLNFAQGAMGLVGGYAWWQLQYQQHLGFVPAAILGILIAALLGALVHLLLMRPLRKASPLVRVVATLGVLITLQSYAVLQYSDESLLVHSELPSSIIDLSGGITVPVDRLILLGIAALLTGVLWLTYRRTRFGLATTAVAENQRAAAALGWSPDVIATANWALGSALAALGAILLAPIVTLEVSSATSIVVAAMAAALIAGFRSFPIAFAAAVALGIAQTIIQRYVQTPGVSSSVPFLVIIVVIVVTGRALPLRDYFLQRLPSIGTGRIRPGYAALAVVVVGLLQGLLADDWSLAITSTLATGLVVMSIVVLTGYAGQLSLAQFAFAGFGAWIAGRSSVVLHLPFLAAGLVGVLATVPLGVLFALPAVRARGINLAVVTLGLGSALELMVFNNGDLTGGFGGTQVDAPSILGLDFQSVEHPARYGLLTLVVFTLVAIAVANVRRGRTGRRLIAVRTNERAAAALGISVAGAKVYAFALSAGIAAVGGILLAFQSTTLVYTGFTSFQSITMVAWAVLGGLGYVLGSFFGAFLAPGTLGVQVSHSIFGGGSVDNYVPLIGGLFLLIIVVSHQNGMAREMNTLGRLVDARLRRLVPRRRTAAPAPLAAGRAERVPARALKISGLTVRYGPTVAVEDVSLTVQPGKVIGLIGPNGAGKTSLIDAVTGFTASEGSMELDGREIGGLSAVRRTRAGLSRSFQSLELFDDSTVLDNIRAACDPDDRISYLRDLVYPRQPELPGNAVAAIKEFKLEGDLDTIAEDLPYGKRRLLAIARAVARRPSVLLLDEPAAGLGDVETAELVHVVRRLADEWGMGVLVVEHDMNFVMNVCDEIVVLDFGRTIAAGTPDLVRSDPAVRAAYLGEDEEPVVSEPATAPLRTSAKGAAR